MRLMQAAPEAIREDRENNTLIIPMVAIREGVFQCANCPAPAFYPASEFGRHPGAWNDRMVTIDHPKLAGQFVSAGTDGIWERTGLGRIKNARLDGKKLKVEAHIDMTKVAEVGSAALELIDQVANGDPIEVSVAAWVDTLQQFGTYEDREFKEVQVNYVPDHIAILPAGVKGACSWEDGCGAPRVNADCGCGGEGECQCSAPAAAELADTDRRALLNGALAKTVTEFFWIVAVFDDHVVYQTEREQTFSRDFTIDEDSGAVTLSDEAIEGTIVTEFMPITVEEEESDMGREEAVNQLIASSASEWHEDDRTFLMEVPDSQFAKLSASAAAAAGQTEDTASAAATDEAAAESAGDTASAAQDAGEAAADEADTAQPAASQVPSLQDVIANADPMYRETIEEGVQLRKQRRARIIDGLKASGRCDFTDDELEACSTRHLEHLAKMAGLNQPRTVSDYSGQAPAASTRTSSPFMKSPAPVDWATSAAE